MIISVYYSHIMAAMSQTGLSIEEVAKACIEHHVTGFDVILSQADETCLENAKKLKECGMTCCALPAHTDFLHNSDEALIEKIISTAKQLGVSVIMAIPGLFNEGEDKQAARERSVAPIKRLCELAEKENIFVGVEDYDDANSAVAGIEGVSWYLEKMRELHCIFDTGNFAFMGDDTLAAFSKFKSRITRQIHCNDRALTCTDGARARVRKTGVSDFPVAVGSGEIPHAEILSTLKSQGFDGIITIENFGGGNMLSNITQSGDFIFKTITSC